MSAPKEFDRFRAVVELLRQGRDAAQRVPLKRPIEVAVIAVIVALAWLNAGRVLGMFSGGA